MPLTSAEKQSRYRARLNADPFRRAIYLEKHRLWRQRAALKSVKNDINSTFTEPYSSFSCSMSCKLHHPFTAVVAGPSGSGKTAWVLKLIQNACEMIEPAPTRIWYCYGEYQPIFSSHPYVHFHEGLPQLSDEVFDGRQPSMIVVDDLMSETNQLVANIFTKISHHRNISVLYLTQNMFDKNKYARTISLNAHYLVLFKNPRDAGQFATMARQIYPNSWRFAVEAYQDATSVPYGYLVLDLRPDQDERCRLRTNVFPGEQQYVFVKR